jgi:translation initiation factor 3 subunit I
MIVTQTAKEEFARVKGHFGPINSLAFNPSGTQYCSGAEDGFLRVHNFDQDYFNYKYYCSNSVPFLSLHLPL